METHGVALGYWGDKIRYILIIRVRFTTEFFFEHGFIGLTRMLRSWRYCLPDSSHYMSWKSRDFVPGYSRFARYCLQGKACRFVVLSLCIMDYELCIMNYAL